MCVLSLQSNTLPGHVKINVTRENLFEDSFQQVNTTHSLLYGLVKQVLLYKTIWESCPDCDWPSPFSPDHETAALWPEETVVHYIPRRGRAWLWRFGQVGGWMSWVFDTDDTGNKHNDLILKSIHHSLRNITCINCLIVSTDRYNTLRSPIYGFLTLLPTIQPT